MTANDAHREASLRHVLGRLDVLRLRVAGLVTARRSLDASPDDPFLGLYLSDDRIDDLLRNDRVWVSPAIAADQAAAVEREADAAVAAGAALRLRLLADRFSLDALDIDLLLGAMAPDIDERFERYYGYLNDDVTRRRVSVGLALGLSGVAASDAEGRRRLELGSSLVGSGLLEVQEPDRPFLTRPLIVPDRVTAHVLGADEADGVLDLVLVDVPPTGEPPSESLRRAVADAHSLVYVYDREAAAVQLAVDAARAAGVPPVVIDLRRLEAAGAADVVLTAAVREARLTGGVLIAGPIEALVDTDPALVQRLTSRDGRLVLAGLRPWDPVWANRAPFIVESTLMSADARARLWAAAFATYREEPVEPGLALAQYRLGAAQIRRAAQAASTIAQFAGRPVSSEDMRRGARQQNAAGLEHLARRIEAQVTWDDLVLPPTVRAALQSLTGRARHRERVLGEWRMRPGGGRGTGITALFAGDSGTGKTMSAEVMAGALGIDLYIVNLATVVDKYIGETEKNLDRIFAEAADVNGILLFDEADALFGQRSEVRDSHDRYANIEVAYLLQRMESFDGLAVLSTNLRSNIDEAFMRRLDAVIDFPTPDVAQRRQLWERTLAALPLDDVDLDFCAEAFELTGGNIRSIAITIAYRVAADRRAVTMADVVASVGEEYRKLGRLCLEAEFGRYFRLLRS